MLVGSMRREFQFINTINIKTCFTSYVFFDGNWASSTSMSSERQNPSCHQLRTESLRTNDQKPPIRLNVDCEGNCHLLLRMSTNIPRGSNIYGMIRVPVCFLFSQKLGCGVTDSRMGIATAETGI